MPAEIHPMLATLVDDPFSDSIGSLNEVGRFSIDLFISGGQARFVSRTRLR